jgi:hypothetical protein
MIEKQEHMEKDRVFVTETSLDFQTKPPSKIDAWLPDMESEKQTTFGRAQHTAKMPPIKPNCVEYSEFLNHNKKLKPKDFSEKAKSDNEVTSKTNSVEFFQITNGVFRKRTMSENPAIQSTAIYRQVTGLDIRESARASLEVATTFNKMSWLQQVQLAIDLNKNTFKRHVHSRSSK